MLLDEVDWVLAELVRRKTVTFEVSAKPSSGLLSKNSYSRTGSFELVIDIHNRTDKRSPEIDAIYLYTSEKWTIKQDGKLCGHTAAEKGELKKRHILETPTKRLGSGAWNQVRCDLEASLWTKWGEEGVEPKDSYRVQGYAIVEISTSEGAFPTRIELDVEFDEIPF